MVLLVPLYYDIFVFCLILYYDIFIFHSILAGQMLNIVTTKYTPGPSRPVETNQAMAHIESGPQDSLR